MMISKKVNSLSDSPTLAMNQKVSELKSEGKDVISLGVGEPDFPTPIYIKYAAIKALNRNMTKYTVSSGTPTLKKAIIDKFRNEYNLNYTPDNILVSAGAKHALWNSIFTLLNEGDEAIIFSPYWVSYPEQIKIANARPVIVATDFDNEFQPKIADIKKAITKKTKLILLNSPNNPTGAVYSEKFIKDVTDLARENDLWIISDEIYEKIIYDGVEHHNIANYYKEKTIIINGVSKAYSMTGWRIGYAAGPKEVILQMAKLQGQVTSCPNSIAQYASQIAISDEQEELNIMYEQFKLRRDYIVDRLNNIDGIECKKPKGTFYVFCDVEELMKKMNFNNTDEVVNFLLDKANVATVSSNAFGYKNFIRMSYANSMENIEEAMDRIERILNEK